MERGIICTAKSVNDILEGRKSQTRRIIKLKDFDISDTPGYRYHFRGRNGCWNDVNEDTLLNKYCPFKVGNLLWVRETWAMQVQTTLIQYKAAGDIISGFNKWKSALFMKKEYARIWLEITGVRVEELQNIMEDDAKKEGVEEVGYCRGRNKMEWKAYVKDYTVFSAAASYSTLWESIHGKDSWELNPWVWVIDFKKIDKEEK